MPEKCNDKESDGVCQAKNSHTHHKKQQQQPHCMFVYVGRKGAGMRKREAAMVCMDKQGIPPTWTRIDR